MPKCDVLGSQLAKFLWWSPSASAVSLSTATQMWLVLRLLHKTFFFCLEQQSWERTIGALTDLLKESLSPCRQLAGSSCLVSQCSLYRGSPPHLPLARGHRQTHICPWGWAPLSSLPAAPALHPCLHVGRCQSAREAPPVLWSSLAICFCEQPLLMGWDFSDQIS